MSVPFDAVTAARWMGAELVRGAPDAELGGASIDSRSLAAGELFVAIRGPRHDGHDHLEAAAAAGAAGFVIERGRRLPAALPEDRPVLAVDDTTRALGALAAGHRAGFDGPLVAITGSNGKTTTKEMCAAILGVMGPCLKNEGNLNNEYGLPLTLLRREAEQRSVVVELGMNHRGEIARLAAIARPTVGVITNVGTAHIEHLGSREEIALEKGDLVAALEPGDVAVLNADDPRVLAQAERTRARVVRFGFDREAEVRADDARAVAGGRFAFTLRAPQGRAELAVAGLGETAVINALAAAAGALAAGASPEQVAQGLALYRPVPGRLEPIALPGGGLLVNDAYNANPQSMEVALRILARLAGEAAAQPARGIAVIGDMGELGATGEEAHREAGRLAANLGIDRLYALGERAAEVIEGARKAGMDAESVCVAADWKELAEALAGDLREGDRILVKGSRAMRMERIVDHLRQAAGAQG